MIVLRRMKITYDKKVDALNVVIKNGKVAKSVEVAPEVVLDFDKNGSPLYLEIIGASEKMGKENFSRIAVCTKPISARVSA